jgi:hypothetical protein
MEDDKIKKISELLGSYYTIKESSKSIKKKDERFFYELVENLCQIEAVWAILRTIGVHTDVHDNPYVTSIAMLMEKQFGKLKTSIVLWWVFESISPEGDIYPLVDENQERHIIKTPTQLYKFLKRYDGK